MCLVEGDYWRKVVVMLELMGMCRFVVWLSLGFVSM